MRENKRVEICGGIAAGKTTLSNIFSLPGYFPVFEDFKKSPFWEAFYTNPGNYIFETEISFILLHYHQIKNSCERNNTNLVCDFSFLLDLAYAKIGIAGSQLKAFECVLNEIQNELPKPDLYVYLDCDAATQLKRIKNRNRPEESKINIDFLDSLNEALKDEVEKINKERVIKINSVENDFANNKSVQSQMTKLIMDKLKK